jgi:serine/threonine protein kinase
MSATVYGERWENKGSIGEGGQARVYQVMDKLAKRQPKHTFALKELKNPKRNSRFAQEFEAARRIDHPRVIKIIDSDLEHQPPYLVMPFYGAGNLEKAAGNLQLEQVLDLFLGISEGLAAAHSVGVVHRDLKPANILLESPVGPPVVSDFGLAFLKEGERYTSTPEVIGSVGWTAPEAEGGRVGDVTPATDVYVMGKILYWLLTGRRLPREDLLAPGWRLAEHVPQPAAEHLTRFLGNLLKRDPRERLPDAGQVANAFRSTRRVILGNYNAVGAPGQPCRYCGLGTYHDWYGGSLSLFPVGVAPAGHNGEWKLLRCDQCGHIEIFNLGQGVRATARYDWGFRN